MTTQEQFDAALDEYAELVRNDGAEAPGYTAKDREVVMGLIADARDRLRAMFREALVAAGRYEEVRKWSPVVFCNAFELNLRTGKPFDEIVDDLRPFTNAGKVVE